MREQFIPLSIEMNNTNKSSYFFSTKKGVMMAVAMIPAAIWVPYIASVTKSFLGLLGAFVSYGMCYFMFMRYVILEETTWKKIFKTLELNKISSPEYFWGVDRVDEEGIIHYKYSGGSSLRKAVVLKLVRGSKIGKDVDYGEEFSEVIREALWEVLEEELDTDIVTVLEKNTVPRNIQRMYENIEKIEDEGARIVAKKHVQNLAIKSKYRERMEVSYMIIYFDTPTHFKNMGKYTKRVKDVLSGSGFFKICEIADKSEVDRFVSTHLGIKTLPSSLDKNDINSFKMYGEVVRIFDEYGNEEWLEGDRDIEQEIYEHLERMESVEDKDEWGTNIEDLEDMDEELKESKVKKIGEKIGLVLIGKHKGDISSKDSAEDEEEVIEEEKEEIVKEEVEIVEETEEEKGDKPKKAKSDLDIYLSTLNRNKKEEEEVEEIVEEEIVEEEIDLDKVFLEGDKENESKIDLDNVFGGQGDD